MRTGRVDGQHPPPPPPPSHHDGNGGGGTHIPDHDGLSHMEGVSHLTAKFAHFCIVMPTPAFLTSKFRRGLNGEIADHIASVASRDFGTLVQQCSKKRKTGEPKAKGASGSTSWRDRKFEGKGKGKQFFARQAPNQFKRTSTQQGSATRPSTIPRCTGCGRSHVGPCSTGQIICFHCGKEGHYARDCPSSAARAAAIQAVPLQMVFIPPIAAPVVPPATGRVYTLDRQQSDRALNVMKGTVSIGSRADDVLFGSGVTHSFIVTPIAVGLELPFSVFSPPLRMTTATEEKCDTSSVHRDLVF
ncbi:uncharacterized protein LOC133306132 [Gastrolobium bilobum]|uniref:uncharacterized protein LOC133306132 n=1 Tax=Gastrolobium bilobum TaxID=150636 RepID=UPI002AB090FC|nr:uncharacterized protein LOC133306132 [Gastrolobium bilobum]